MKKIIKTSKAPAPIGPYNQAILSGNTLYTSGQIAIDPSSGKLKIGTIKEETLLVMENISDMTNFSEINEVYGSYFNEDTAPARETVEVANLPKFVNVEISMIAVK